MKEYKVGEYICLVGGSAKENWEILSQSEQKYIFFHLTSFPSCYVILQTEEKVDKSILQECAEICLDNTKQKNMSGVYVDCTPVGNVRKGEKIGC